MFARNKYDLPENYQETARRLIDVVIDSINVSKCSININIVCIYVCMYVCMYTHESA